MKNKISKKSVTSVTSVPSASTSEKIIIFLYRNGRANLTQISQGIGVSESNIKAELNRPYHKKVFESLGRAGGRMVYDLVKEQREIMQRREEAIALKMKNQEAVSQKEQSIIQFFQNNFAKLFKRVDIQFHLSLKNFLQQDHHLFDEFVQDYNKFKPLIFVAVSDHLQDKKIRVSFCDYDFLPTRTIESIRSEDLDSIIKLKVRLSNISPINPRLVSFKVECCDCGSIGSILQPYRKKLVNFRCLCKSRNCKVLSREYQDHINFLVEDFDIGFNAYKMLCEFSNEKMTETFYSKFISGSDLEVLGVLRSDTETTTPTEKFFLEVLTFERLEFFDFDYVESDEIIFRDICEKIKNEGLGILGFCPEIYGLEPQKEALQLQLIQKRNDPSSGGDDRTRSNILFIGDPGVAKTQLIKYASEVSPSSKLLSCGGSTTVGVTATVENLRDGDGWTLSPGALVRCHDILCLDEFNLLSDDDKPKLQEAMSQKVLTINKATIHAKIPISASILASANPVTGRFNPNFDLVKQFNLFSPILNRFDLVFVIQDILNLEKDREIATKMISRAKEKVVYDLNFHRKFFNFLNQQPEPTISKEIETYFVQHYTSIRQLSRQNKEINTRYFEALIRLSKAYAKLRLSPQVSVDDLNSAVLLLSKTFYFIDKSHSTFNYYQGSFQ